MKERLKQILADMGILPKYHFFRYGFKKNMKNYIAKKKNASYKKKTLRKIFPAQYAKYSKNPIEEDKVVFIETRLPEVTNSFRVLYNELAGKYDYRIHTHFMLDATASKKEYIVRCNDMLKDVATAKYVFLNEANNVISCIKKRPETKVMQMWHGCGAFKKWGMSTADLIFGLTEKDLKEYPNYKNLDYVTVSSPEVSWAYVEAMDLSDKPETVVPLGVSRSDIFYDESFRKKAYEKLYALMPSAKGKKVILYAPTFRGRVAKAKTPDMLDVRMFKEALGDEYVLIFKHHPFVKKPMPIEYADSEFARDLTDACDIEELLCVADICISDYSSLVFEYALFEKPMIFFSYDISEYFDWRGFYYDYDELAPGPVFVTNSQMIDYIQHVDERFDRERVIKFREKFMSACDGHATERIMEEMFGRESLEKHRRKDPQVGAFDRLPRADIMFGERMARLDLLRWYKTEGQKIYDKACESGVVKNCVGIFTGEKTDETTEYFKNVVAENGKFVLAEFGDFPKKQSERIEYINRLAGCAYIFIADSKDIINGIKIRPETKVILSWEELVPIKKFGYAGGLYKSGLKRDYTAIAPLHAHYDVVALASEGLKDIFSEAFGTEDNSCFMPIGSIMTDMLFDKDRKKAAKKKLNSLFPNAKGKKVLFYKPLLRKSTRRTEVEMFLDYMTLREHFIDKYVLIYISPDSKLEKKDNLFAYCTDFIYNATETMTVTECMLSCDAMIGDYDPDIYRFALTGKPLFLYAPDRKWFLTDDDTYFDYESIAPGPVIDTTEELVEMLEDLDGYDHTARKEFKEKFLGACDGKSAERLMQLMSIA